MNRAQLIVSDACIGCGRCINVCPGGILHMGADGKPCIQDFDEFGWNGCWQCQHCLAVCPKAAVSVLDRRPDMLFCGAPHILIPHAPLGHGEPVQDVIIAGTYFELLGASRGLGAVMMTFPLDVLALMPDVRALPGLPEDHYVGMIAGFGYPQIPYARTTQRRIDEGRIHRLSPAWSNLPIALPERS